MFFIILLLYFFISLLVTIVRLPFRWFSNSISSARQDKRNFYKPILVVLLIAYAITRLHFIYDIYMSDEPALYTERDLTPRREERLSKYIKLQGDTYFIDRYGNMIHHLREDDRPIMAKTIFILTCPRRVYKFVDLIWYRHLENLVKESSEEEVDTYLNQVKWLSKQKKERILMQVRRNLAK